MLCALSFDIAWQTDTDGRFTWCSQSRTCIGTPAREMIGLTRREFAGGSRDDPLWRAHEADLQARRPFRDFRYPRVGADGRTRYMATSGEPRFDESGRFQGYVGVGRDVTAEEEARLAVAAAADQMRDALAALPEAFALFDAADRLVSWNSAYEQLYEGAAHALVVGADREAVLRAQAAALYPHDDAAAREAYVREQQQPEEAGERHERQLPDGRWVLGSRRRTAAGGSTEVWTDITATKRMEACLRRSEEKFRHLVEGSLQGTVVFRADHKPLFANQAYADIFGYDGPEAILALDAIDALLAPEEHARCHAYTRRRLEDGAAPERALFQGRRRDGSALVVEVFPTVTDWEGAPAVLVNALDVTEREQRAHHVEAGRRMLEQALDHLPMWIAIKDPALNYRWVNRTACRDVGLSAEQMRDRSLRDVTIATPENTARLMAMDARVLARGSPPCWKRCR